MNETINLKYDGQEFPAYVARPKNEVRGGIIVVHEIWALNDHTRNVADRFASEGFVAIAPNLLSQTDIAEKAGTLPLDLFNPETRNEAQPKLRELMTPVHEPGFADKTIGKLKQCFDYIFSDFNVNEKVFITGFCFGGSYTYTFATLEERLLGAVPFYGHAPLEVDKLEKINCPILAFYGEKDENLVKDLPELEDKMKEAKVVFTAVVYPDSGHAFFNDTNPYAYNKEAADDAWQKTLQFLDENI